MSGLSRSMALWVPDWPVVAARGPGDEAALCPTALTDAGFVLVCDEAARSAGVRRGMRVRQAQASCPGLNVRRYEPDRDVRAFAPVLAALDEVVAGIAVLRPGLCLLRARGPGRYYGSELAAARALIARAALEAVQLRVGVADTPFAARHAAGFAPSDESLIVPPGDTRSFLAPLPVSAIVRSDVLRPPPTRRERESLISLLHRLGLSTLGDFAALPRDQVRQRFGAPGEQMHELACAQETDQVVPDPQRRRYETVLEFADPLERSDQVTFAFRTRAEEFVHRLLADKRVCTTIALTITDDRGNDSRRQWSHPQWFRAADITDRVRWQLAENGRGSSGLVCAVCAVRVEPVDVASATDYEAALWSEASHERVSHELARIQGLLGHEAVVTAQVGAGRMLAERQRLTPWGERSEQAAQRAPWPGSLPPPHPSRVFRPPFAVVVRDAAGNEPSVDARGRLSAAPHRFAAAGPPLRAVTAWAGPWPVWERWWDAAAAHDAYRFQLVDDADQAWLVLYEQGRWQAEAKYD